MLSVLLPEADIAARLTGRLSLAAVNSPTTCVVSGPTDEIETLNEALIAEGLETQRLHIDVAAHSPMLEPYLAEFRARVSAVALSAPEHAVRLEPDRPLDHRRGSDRPGLLGQPPAAHGALQRWPGARCWPIRRRCCWKSVPGRALTSLARQQPSKPLGLITSLRHPNEALDDVMTMMTALGRMWTLGVEPAWDALEHAGEQGQASKSQSSAVVCRCPTYPFERKRYWIEAGVPTAAAERALPAARVDTARQADLADWFTVPDVDLVARGDCRRRGRRARARFRRCRRDRGRQHRAVAQDRSRPHLDGRVRLALRRARRGSLRRQSVERGRLRRAVQRPGRCRRRHHPHPPRLEPAERRRLGVFARRGARAGLLRPARTWRRRWAGRSSISR